MKKILIIGGMGPQAGITLHKKIIRKATELGASNGDDFPSIFHVSVPVPEFIDSTETKQAALEVIKRHLYCFWQRKIYSYCNILQHSTLIHQ